MAGRKKGKWSRRSQNEWRSLMARFNGSGMSVEGFCRREAISATSFYRWRSLLSDGRSEEGGDPRQATPAFVDLGTLKSASSPRPWLDLKLDLGDGVILHLVRS